MNKTDDPRSWALDPSVAEALRWYETHLRPDAERSSAVFTNEHGRQLESFGLAGLLREHLRTIGLKSERPELFETTEQRQRIRVHDLRGTSSPSVWPTASPSRGWPTEPGIARVR